MTRSSIRFHAAVFLVSTSCGVARGQAGAKGDPGAAGEPGSTGPQGPAGPASSTQLHVDAASGNDQTGDGSEAAPFATINYAVDQAGQSATPVDILVAGGTYDASVQAIILHDAEVSVWGGYNASNWSQRDPEMLPSTILGSTNNFCVRLQGSSSFASAGLDNNDLFDCAAGLLITPTDGALTDVSTINGNEDFTASGNLSFDLLGGDFFSNPAAHNWRLVSGSSLAADFETVKQGGLVLVVSGARDFDDAPRPQGVVGSIGWSIGAFQQNN